MNASPLYRVKTYLKTYRRATAGELRAELGLGQFELEEVLDYLTQSGRLSALTAQGGLEDPSEEEKCGKTTGGCSCGTAKTKAHHPGGSQAVQKPQTRVYLWKEPLPKS